MTSQVPPCSLLPTIHAGLPAKRFWWVAASACNQMRASSQSWRGLSLLHLCPFSDTIRRAGRRDTMTPVRIALVATFLLFGAGLYGQIDRIVIPAGTPEDQALNAINTEQDSQKRLAMYEDFLQKFASNPAAVAYGNWQLSQYYQSNGD